MKFKNLPKKDPASVIKNKLALKKIEAKESLDKKVSKAGFKLLLGGTMASSALLLSPASHLSLPTPSFLLPAPASSVSKQVSLSELLSKSLKTFLPKDVYLLSYEKKQKVSEWVSAAYGVRAVTTLSGNTLPAIYGLMGGEQHLMRYPGDTTLAHMRDDEDFAKFLPSGMAPGKGAWGYFASSKEDLTPELAANERYYVAVQTFLLPNWSTDWNLMKSWYKYRKVIIVNTETNQACVAVVGDSGPSTWTGKVFGGSPEVMDAVGLQSGPRKGPVVILFVDDPDNKVPLGPIPFVNAMNYV